MELLYRARCHVSCYMLTSLAPSDPEANDEHNKRWMNINAFAARLTEKSSKTESFDYSLSGLWSLREGLEETEQANEAAIQAASIWLIYAGSTIRRYCHQGKSFDGKMGRGGPNFTSKEWTGYNEERWSAWQKALASAENSCGPESKELVAEALKRMKELA